MRLRVAAAAVLTAAIVGVLAAGAPADGRAVEPLLGSVTRIIEQPRHAGSSWGIPVVNPRSGETVYRLGSSRQLHVPGSTSKLLGALGAWKTLGPDSRITTPVYALGARAGSTLTGNLVLVTVGRTSAHVATRSEAARAVYPGSPCPSARISRQSVSEPPAAARSATPRAGVRALVLPCLLQGYPVPRARPAGHRRSRPAPPARTSGRRRAWLGTAWPALRRPRRSSPSAVF